MRPGPPGSDLSEAPSIAPPLPHSPWRSPLPNLFGGFAAMLAWIGLALLTLACSYAKLNSFLSEPQSDNRANSDGDVKSSAQSGPPVILHQPFAVVMAGEEKPTYIAMPTCSWPGSFDCAKGEEKAVHIGEGRSVAPALEPE